MPGLQKDVASQNITFCLVNASTGAALTGATVTTYVSKDNGSQASGGGTVTEKGNGQYNYAPTQAETNAVDVGFLFTATSAIPVNADFHTDIVDGNGYTCVNLVDIAGSAVSTSSPQLGVNLVDIAGSAVSTSSAQLGVNAVDIAGQAAQLDGNNLLKVDVEDVNGSATVESGISLLEALRYMAAALAGVLSGAATTTITIKAINNSGTTRIVATVDSNGDRSAITLS